MRIRSIEKADREFFIDRCHAFYRTPACDHELPQPSAHLSCSCTARPTQTV